MGNKDQSDKLDRLVLKVIKASRLNIVILLLNNLPHLKDQKATQALLDLAGGGTGGSVDLSKYALKTDLNAYLSRNDASRDYVTKGWSTQTFAFKNELGGFIRKNEVGQYALTPGDASARYVNKIEGRAFAKREDIDNIANEIKKYLVDNGITSTGSGLANVIIDFFKEIDKRTK